eukprot:gene6899-biopygen4206
MVHHTTHITAQHPGHRLSEDKLVEFDLCQCLLCGTVLSGTSATRTSHRRRQSQRTRLNGIGPTNPTPQPLSLDFLEAPSKEDRAWLSTRPRTLRILHRTEFRTWIQKIRAVPTGYAAKNEKRRHEAQIRVLDLPRLYLQPKSKEGDEGADNEKNDTTGEGRRHHPSTTSRLRADTRRQRRRHRRRRRLLGQGVLRLKCGSATYHRGTKGKRTKEPSPE